MMNYDVVVVSKGDVMRGKSDQQGAQHAAVWCACADAEDAGWPTLALMIANS